MTFKKFVNITLLLSFLIILFVAALNIFLDEFGLFFKKKPGELRVYAYERTTKYLFSYKYIPENFDSILIGPSLSDIEMDTEKLDGFDVYNLSLNGGNISELKYLVDNVIERGNLKLMIVCLDPYITKNSGKKTTAIDPSEYYASLGSFFTVKYYLKKALTLLNQKKDHFKDSFYGFRHNNWNVINDLKEQQKYKDIVKKLKTTKNEKKTNINLDTVAIEELDSILKLAREKEIRIIAYYYPKLYDIYNRTYYKKEYKKFKNEIDNLLAPEDIVINFNTKRYDYIRKKYDTYSDGSHLTEKGANLILEVLQKEIDNIIMSQS